MPVNAADARDVGSTLGQEDPPGVGNGSVGNANLLQYYCLENSMEAWQATVHGATKSQTLLAHKQTHAHWDQGDLPQHAVCSRMFHL